jgi:hypothetical protein
VHSIFMHTTARKLAQGDTVAAYGCSVKDTKHQSPGAQVEMGAFGSNLCAPGRFELRRVADLPHYGAAFQTSPPVIGPG